MKLTGEHVGERRGVYRLGAGLHGHHLLYKVWVVLLCGGGGQRENEGESEYYVAVGASYPNKDCIPPSTDSPRCPARRW